MINRRNVLRAGTLPFNHRYAGIRPAGIVACGTTRDVRTAVRWARTVGLPAVPRINQVPPDATAFVHRNAVFILAAETSWAD
ncbi:FAD-binding oxidoreductase [Streptomyces sp. 5-10]|uniref:FAD-binding oxidoreductase n=1 Tax=Streptomyces sp. 5-10 TaxID=878925 RepID=UPI00168A9C05|nr:FAD-binding oxidoreductase [Streptomyces sp. 5-10]MBD3003567.1 FAD-binding oxidoreductase [Streptomyces sp. 5-10]